MSINIIGVTGPSGSGKSSILGYAKENDIPFIDADEVYHSLLTKNSECTNALVGEFGSEILNADGTPDRKRLGELVFSDEEKLSSLNKIVLGFVIRKIEAAIDEYEGNGYKNVIVDAPTLIESGFNKECHAVISVLCPRDTRIERICERDGISYEMASARVDAQPNDEFYIDSSDFILINDRDIESFTAQVTELLDVITKN